MEPDYLRSADAATETVNRYGTTDPLAILRQIRNVLLISFSAAAIADNGLDAMTLVNREDGNLQYIVLYNSALSAARLRRALSRELGHVILSHDRNTTETVSEEEADCFSFHLICGRTICINFRPSYQSISASFKDARKFSSMDELKRTIADERTRYAKYIGNPSVYSPEDVQVIAHGDDFYGGWKNYSGVFVGNTLVGYCGE